MCYIFIFILTSTIVGNAWDEKIQTDNDASDTIIRMEREKDKMPMGTRNGKNSDHYSFCLI